jgi:hypothetical protein
MRTYEDGGDAWGVVCLCVPGCRGRKRRRVDEAGDDGRANSSQQHLSNTPTTLSKTKPPPNYRRTSSRTRRRCCCCRSSLCRWSREFHSSTPNPEPLAPSVPPPSLPRSLHHTAKRRPAGVQHVPSLYDEPKPSGQRQWQWRQTQKTGSCLPEP